MIVPLFKNIPEQSKVKCLASSFVQMIDAEVRCEEANVSFNAAYYEYVRTGKRGNLITATKAQEHAVNELFAARELHEQYQRLAK